jgi:hypothetical protein
VNAIEIRRIASLYSMLVCASMMGMWVVFLLMGQVPELESIPVETAFSILADSITGLILLIAGYGLYTGRRWGFRAFLVSLGALFYSLIIAIGYFAQKGDAPSSSGSSPPYS